MKEKVDGAILARARLGKLYAMPLDFDDIHILLAVAAGEVSHVGDIVAYGAVSRGRAYSRVNRLAEEGYLSVQRSTADKRKVLVTPLPKGLRWARLIVEHMGQPPLSV